MHPDLPYYIALTCLKGIGHITAKHLISYCGGAKEVFTATPKQLLKIPEIGKKVVAIINEQNDDIWRRVENELDFIEKNNITPVLYLEKTYPSLLKICPVSPTILYYKGNATLDPARCLSIIGTRNATEYGKEMCEQLIHDIAQFDNQICIVSGLAFGIDAAAHRACLKYQLPTIGIVAHGLDRIYPPEHNELAHKMVQNNGGILSELMTENKPERENFPQRNRLVAGIANATIVVQTGLKGGSLITAEYAHNYNRDIFAMPGKINDPYAMGCHKLIKQQKATLITCAADVIEALNWEKNDQQQQKPAQQNKLLFVELTEQEKKVIAIMPKDTAIHLNDLMSLSNLSTSLLAAILLGLEFKGLICLQPGSRYKIVE